DRLKVSRQPVREAFIKLSEIGLVRVLPQRGTFITKISAKEVLDARFVREAVECAIARRASAGIAISAVTELRDIIGAQRKAARAMQQHLREIFKTLPRLASAHPEMFEAEDTTSQRARPRSRKAAR